IQKGGCHPTDGCQDGTPFTGASFSYLAANVTLDPSSADPNKLAEAGVEGTQTRQLLPGYIVRDVGGVRLGFIGVVLQGTPNVVVAQAVRGLAFHSEPDAVNEAAGAL